MDTWAYALGVANGRAVLTGYRHEVWRGISGKWHVTRSSARLRPVVTEPCS